MKTDLHSELIKEVSSLKKLTKKLSIADLVGFVAMEHFTLNNNIEMSDHLKLHSPLRQGMYLLGLAVHRKEPRNPRVFNDIIKEKIIISLNSIFLNYALAYFPENNEEYDENWFKHRELAMPAFINFYATGFKASTDQIKQWIKFYFNGYEDVIKSEFGITHLDMIKLGEYFESEIQKKWDRLEKLAERVHSIHKEHISRLDSGISIEESFKLIKSDSKNEESFKEYFQSMNGVFSFDFRKAKADLDSNSIKCIETHFISTRGKSKDITYITEENAVIKKPIITVDKRTFYVILNNSFYQAIIENIESFLMNGNNREKYLRLRDNRLEEHSVAQFTRLMATKSSFFEGLYETEDSHYEHDLVISHKRTLLIVEAKASPPRLPFRNPEKAYNRKTINYDSIERIDKKEKV